ncbi:MAG: PilZ domain-containing protein [Lysobacterales bacterium]|nr:MAG: PilZ domain-containing protein [Xanthomonadales bacterium]
MNLSIGKGKRERDGEIRERRCVSRTSTEAQAYVSRQGLPRFKGKVRDLSSTGVFVATGPLPIRERHIVKLNLVLDLGKVVRLHNRPAIVVRRSREGVALKFF